MPSFLSKFTLLSGAVVAQFCIPHATAQEPVTIPSSIENQQSALIEGKLVNTTLADPPKVMPAGQAPAATAPAVPAPTSPIPVSPASVTPAVSNAVMPAPQAIPAASPCLTDGCGAFDFSKVPVTRAQPRLGFFTIPPTGKGEYSLLDWLHGKCRDEAPKSGYPAFALMGPSFYDANFAYLDKAKEKDWAEELKRIRVGDSMMVSFGGSAWNRFMSEGNSRLGTSANSYVLDRARLYTDIWYEDRFRLFTEVITAWSFMQDLAPLAVDQNKFDFLNLFTDIKLTPDDPTYLRIGRQELLLGSQRLISSLDWANTRRTFQGARLTRTTEKFDFDAFWLQPVIPNANRLDSVDNNVNFAGAWGTYKPKKGTSIDAYYLFLDDTNRRTQQGINFGSRTLHTLGGRYAGDIDNTYLWDVEGAVQVGSNRGRDVVAGMVSAGAGYHSKTLPWNPTAWIYYDFASGDKNPNAGNFNTFNQLFPFGHYYMGWADLIGRQNIHDVNMAIYLYPNKWITTWVQYHNFWLAERKDALYNIAGNAVRRDATGRAGNYVGSEIDYVVNFHIGPRSDLLIGYNRLIGGDFLKNTRSATRAVNSDVFFAQVGFRW
jgi:hypothetical protein